jgi:hypothetical protein
MQEAVRANSHHHPLLHPSVGHHSNACLLDLDLGPPGKRAFLVQGMVCFAINFFHMLFLLAQPRQWTTSDMYQCPLGLCITSQPNCGLAVGLVPAVQIDSKLPKIA